MRHHGKPRRISAILATTAATSCALVLASAVAAPSAYAGEWAQETCTQPISGLPPAPTEGWVSTISGGVATNGCNPYDGGLVAALGDATPFSQGSGALWTWTAPPGSTIAGGQISYQLYAPQGLAYISTPNDDYQPADVLAVCVTGVACGGQVGGAQGAVVAISHPGGTHIYASAACYGPSGGDCSVNAGGSALDAQTNIYAATVELENNSTPAASGFGGGLLAAGPVTGTQPITFTATDPNGPGVYKVQITLDGQAAYNATPDSSAGHCASAGTDQAGVIEFLYQQPCPQSVAVSVPVATAGLVDGQHAVVVTVTDAATNSSVVLRQSITTSNHTTVSAALNSNLPTAAPPAGGAAVYATVLDPSTQALAHGVRRTYASSALALSGTLRDSAGVPAPGVPITLLTQNGGGGAVAQEIAHATSDAAGHWTFTAPRGPSRLLTIAYGTQPQASAPGAHVTISEAVTPNLSFSVRALGRGRLRFSGRLAITPLGTPRPQIVIEAGKAKQWQSIGQPITVTPTGAYKLTYNAGPKTVGGHYTFRAVAAATNLFSAATSTTRRTVVR